MCLLQVHLNKSVCVCECVCVCVCVQFHQVRIRRVLCGPCRRAKLTPFEENLSELAAGLLPKKDGSLPPIMERSTPRAYMKRSFPAFAGVAVRLLWHALDSLCQRNWSAWGLMYSKI